MRHFVGRSEDEPDVAQVGLLRPDRRVVHLKDQLSIRPAEIWPCPVGTRRNASPGRNRPRSRVLRPRSLFVHGRRFVKHQDVVDDRTVTRDDFDRLDPLVLGETRVHLEVLVLDRPFGGHAIRLVAHGDDQVGLAGQLPTLVNFGAAGTLLGSPCGAPAATH